MKSAISPDIWETKRMLITKLYKDEEWPLKQVIKLVQTRDFHPSESQLRSRLKKWHITKPSRKKYDGSRRLSGAKKNQNQNQSQSQNTMAPKPLSDSLSRLPSSSTYHTLHSQPHSQPLAQQLSQRRVDETDSFSEGSRPSVSTVPELSTSPANRYILPSSPHEDANPPFTSTSAMYPSSTIMAPSTPMTPAVYGMDDSKRPADAQSIYFYPPESSPHAFPATAAVSYPTHAYGPYSDPSPLAVVEHPQLDYIGYHAVHPYLAHQKTNQFGVPLSELPPPLLDGSWASHYHDSHAHQPLSPHSYYPDEAGGLQPLAPLAPPAPIYQAGHVM